MEEERIKEIIKEKLNERYIVKDISIEEIKNDIKDFNGRVKAIIYSNCGIKSVLNEIIFNFTLLNGEIQLKNI